MIIKIIVTLLAILFHVATPSWYLKDFLKVGDFVVIFCSLVNIIADKSSEKNKSWNSIFHFLSLNVFIYFFATAQVLVPDVGSESVSYRLELIANLSFDLPLNVGKVIELLNAIQILLSLVIVIVYGLYRVIFKIKKPRQKPWSIKN